MNLNMNVQIIEEPPNIEKECPICSGDSDLNNKIECCSACKYSLTEETRRGKNQKQFIPYSSYSNSSNIEVFGKLEPPKYDNLTKQQQNMINDYYYDLNDRINEMSFLDQLDDTIDVNSPFHPNKFDMGKLIDAFPFFLNILLIIGKSFALASSSDSYTLIASLFYACLDVISSFVVTLFSRCSISRINDYQKYPLGKSRIASLGIFIFSVVIGCYSLFFSMKCFVAFAISHSSPIITSFCLFMFKISVCIKCIMWIGFSLFSSQPICSTIANDSKNDCFTNLFCLLMYWGSKNIYYWMDSIGGACIFLLITISWILIAIKNANSLIGKTGPSSLERKILYVANKHHLLIKSIENVSCIQLGPFFYADLDILLPGHLPAAVVHDIGESLQIKLEKIEGIQKAWVVVHTAKSKLKNDKCQKVMESSEVITSESSPNST